MTVTIETVESAVLSLFTQFRVYSGGLLDPADLRAQWPATRLRATDFDIGVRELVFTGAVRWVETDEGAKLQLTPYGDWQRRQQSALNRVVLRDGWNRLRNLFPGRPSAEPAMRRRTDHRPRPA